MYNETELNMILDRFNTTLNEMKKSGEILNWVLINKKDKTLNYFSEIAWDKDNIALYLNDYVHTNIPNGLQNNPIVLSYILINEEYGALNDFNDMAWTDRNIDIIESLVYLKKIPMDKVIQEISLKNNDFL